MAAAIYGSQGLLDNAAHIHILFCLQRSGEIVAGKLLGHFAQSLGGVDAPFTLDVASVEAAALRRTW